jgi:phosphoribosylaminoimidazolecarboxamide formyltransferase / IMP cyclohydrolase
VLKNVSGGVCCKITTCVRSPKPTSRVVSERKPTEEEMRALLFAWKVCKHVKSNAILYARDGQSTGVGAGQMSRVDSAKIGAMKAVLPLKGTVAASDAFFPFPDGVEEIAKAGATAIIQPGGSVRDQEVIDAATVLAWRWCSPACGTSGTSNGVCVGRLPQKCWYFGMNRGGRCGPVFRCSG